MELYNRASRLASEGSKIAANGLGSKADDFATLSLDYTVDQVVDALKSEDYATRYRHFNAESNIIIPKAVNALAAGDMKAWSQAVLESQRTGETLLGNQVTETVHLAESAYECGAIASSAFGAGFGGSVWAMVSEKDASNFTEKWRQAYLDKFPQYLETAQWFQTRPGPAAFSIELTS
jgi:galactokinase